MGALDLAVQLRGSTPDVSMTDALIFDVPMELGLELMPIVGPDFLDAERELFDDVIDEVDRNLASAIEALDMRVLVTGTVMTDEGVRERLAREVLDFASSLAHDGAVVR